MNGVLFACPIPDRLSDRWVMWRETWIHDAVRDGVPLTIMLVPTFNRPHQWSVMIEEARRVDADLLFLESEVVSETPLAEVVRLCDAVHAVMSPSLRVNDDGTRDALFECAPTSERASSSEPFDVVAGATRAGFIPRAVIRALKPLYHWPRGMKSGEMEPIYCHDGDFLPSGQRCGIDISFWTNVSRACSPIRADPRWLTYKMKCGRTEPSLRAGDDVVLRTAPEMQLPEEAYGRA